MRLLLLQRQQKLSGAITCIQRVNGDTRIAEKSNRNCGFSITIKPRPTRAIISNPFQSSDVVHQAQSRGLRRHNSNSVLAPVILPFALDANFVLERIGQMNQDGARAMNTLGRESLILWIRIGQVSAGILRRPAGHGVGRISYIGL